MTKVVRPGARQLKLGSRVGFAFHWWTAEPARCCHNCHRCSTGSFADRIVEASASQESANRKPDEIDQCDLRSIGTSVALALSQSSSVFGARWGLDILRFQRQKG